MPSEPPIAPSPDDDDLDIIRGGEVEGAGDPLEFKPAQHREQTASGLARGLLIILAGTGIVHYGTVLMLAYNGQTEALEHVDKFFSAWLPVIAGLVGSAITYYFTRENK